MISRIATLAMLFSFWFGSAFSSNENIDIEKVIVRGTIDPVKKELRTVSQLHLKIIEKNPEELKFFLNPGREVVKILGPGGEELQYRLSTHKLVGYVMVFKQVNIQVPPELQARDSLKLTFFLDGKVKDKGLFKFGNFLSEKGLALTGNVLFPELGVDVEPKEKDPFFWLELELSAPFDWTLATAGEPEVTGIEENKPVSSRTGLTGEQVEKFLREKPTGKRTRYYWEKIGIGEFSLYGGPDWVVHTKEISGVQIRLYTMRADSASASVLLEAAEKTIPVLEDVIGPFPLKDLSIVVPPEMLLGKAAGATANWGVMTLPRHALSWKRWHQENFVHEMIHNYWPFCLRTPADEIIILAEPFANYLDAELWGKIYDDTLASLQSRANACHSYWLSAQVYCERPLIGLSPLDPFFWAGFYSKGPLSVSMLADILGPEQFRRFQQEVFAEGDGKIYSLDSLQAGIERHSQYPCKNLVYDLFKTNIRYDYAISGVKVKDTGPDSCNGDIRITKNQIGEFPMMLKVSFADSAVIKQRIDPQAKEQTIRVRGPAPFREAELDPDVRTLDCDRFNNVYPRRQPLRLAWARSCYLQFPHPTIDWGETALSRRRFIFSPVVDYTDLDKVRFGIGLEARRAYQDKVYLWGAWSDKQEKLRGGAGWFYSPNLARYKLAAHYHDDGLVREGIFTAFLPSWDNWLAFSLGAGYEERPSLVTSTEKLRYSQSAPSFRLGLTIPYLNYGSDMLFPYPGGRSYMLFLHLRKSASIWGGNMDYLQVEGDTRMGLGSLGFRFRWGFSNGVNSVGEGFSLGGRWGYADDRVRMVRGYSLRFARRFLLLNTEYRIMGIPRGSLVFFGDLAGYREVEKTKSQTLLGYGIGIRYWLPWKDWLESALIRVDYGAPKEGFDKGFFYIGMGWGI